MKPLPIKSLQFDKTEIRVACAYTYDNLMMKILFASTVFAVSFIGLLFESANAAELRSDVVSVDSGVAQVPLNGRELIAIRARRENYNAHSFDIVTFYVGRKNGDNPQFDIVPIFINDSKSSRKELHEITVGGGADCKLTDFRLLKAQKERPARLIIADREFGDSFAAPGAVHFTYYELLQNDEGVPSDPPLYFQQKSKSDSRQKYCDVNEAFDRELHMGTSSGRGTEPIY